MTNKQRPHREHARRRFYIDAPLTAGNQLALPHSLARRLGKVLRLADGAVIELFNGCDGAFEAILCENGKAVELGEQTAKMPTELDVSLLVGLPKRDTMDRVLRQVTELGIARIQPVLTDYCVPDKLNIERAETILIEASEQCERLTLPTLAAPVKLQEAVSAHAGPLYWAAERKNRPWPSSLERSCGYLVGPEGGFSPAEVAWLSEQAQVVPVSLGETILRVDTAVTAGFGKLLFG